MSGHAAGRAYDCNLRGRLRVVDRWAERPVTRFERKGTAAGRGIADLRYRRTA